MLGGIDEWTHGWTDGLMDWVDNSFTHHCSGVTSAGISRGPPWWWFYRSTLGDSLILWNIEKSIRLNFPNFLSQKLDNRMVHCEVYFTNSY